MSRHQKASKIEKAEVYIDQQECIKYVEDHNRYVLRSVYFKQKMSIQLENNTPKLDPTSLESEIVVFLYRHLDKAFKPDEVAWHTDTEPSTVESHLESLYESGLVAKTNDDHFHALEQREDLRRYVAAVQESKRMFAEKPAPESARGPPTDMEEIESVRRELTGE